jgi:hypothetical protein
MRESGSRLPERTGAVEWNRGMSIHTIIIYSTLNIKYRIAEIDPIDVELDKEHLFILILIDLLPLSIIFDFLLFNFTDNIVKLFKRLNLNELVGGVVPWVRNNHPKGKANDTII